MRTTPPVRTEARRPGMRTKPLALGLVLGVLLWGVIGAVVFAAYVVARWLT